MDIVLKNQIGKSMVVNVNDMLVKSHQACQHETHQEEGFEVVRSQGLMLNHAKCTFGVKAGKLLGYMVTKKEIEVNHAKVATILGMSPP